MLFSIVCYFFLFTVALGFNVTIYKSSDYNIDKNSPVHIVDKTYEFEFNMSKPLTVDIRLKNKAPDVVATVYVTYKQPTVNKSGYMENRTMTDTPECNHEYCLKIPLIETRQSNKSESKSISVGIQLENVAGPCATEIILQGNATFPDATKEVSDNSLCAHQRCTVVIDLQDVCQGSTNHSQQPGSASSSLSSSQMLAYVIPSVIVMCVVILAIYISIKKFRRRNSDPANTMELKTYSTNEILYADLSFVNGNSQPPSHVEESPYAQIIGVLKPQ